MQFLNEDIGRIVLAAVLGAVLGMEREVKGKAAGFRTLMLVSVGAALFTEMSYYMATLNDKSDATRIASNIVTGIGFIGAGLIFKDKISVHGLTTAATIWTSAAVGMAAGAGKYGLAIETTILAWIILVVMQYLESRFQKLRETRKYKITFTGDNNGLPEYMDVPSSKTLKIESTRRMKTKGKAVMEVTIKAPEQKHDELLKKMLDDNNIQGVSY